MREERQQYGVKVVLRNKRRFLQRRLGVGQFLAFLMWVTTPEENAVAAVGRNGGDETERPRRLRFGCRLDIKTTTQARSRRLPQATRVTPDRAIQTGPEATCRNLRFHSRKRMFKTLFATWRRGSFRLRPVRVLRV